MTRIRRRGQTLGRLVLIVALLTAGAGFAAVVVASRTDDRAAAARRLRTTVRSEIRSVASRTDTTNHGADRPIGDAELVANSVAKIESKSGSVLREASTTDQALARAVDAANAGNLAGSRQIYDGEAADALRRLQDVMNRARLYLAGAQQAAVALQTSAR